MAIIIRNTPLTYNGNKTHRVFLGHGLNWPLLIKKQNIDKEVAYDERTIIKYLTTQHNRSP